MMRLLPSLRWSACPYGGFLALPPHPLPSTTNSPLPPTFYLQYSDELTESCANRLSPGCCKNALQYNDDLAPLNLNCLTLVENMRLFHGHYMEIRLIKKGKLF